MTTLKNYHQREHYSDIKTRWWP